MQPPDTPRKGRGAISNPALRYSATHVERFDDGWETEPEELPPLETIIRPDPARTIIARNNSPDLHFTQSINPYRGCEHGCVYCFARPTHAYLDLSPGLDFETKLYFKENAAELLTHELAHPRYVCSPITLGANTDPYQPVERRLGVTRSLIEVLARTRHPITIVTKSALVLRDLDLLAGMAEAHLVAVMISITSLDDATKRTLEPRAASPARRLQVVHALSEAGVPVGVLVAPIIPLVTDHELEEIVARAAAAGARSAGYVLLRMPHEIKHLFDEWLQAHAPLKAEHVMSLMRQMHGGREYDSTFGHRQRGSGPYAQLIARRFELACQRAGFEGRDALELDTTQFRRPTPGGQLDLWDQTRL
jgi:DNA repair photolyase